MRSTYSRRILAPGWQLYIPWALGQASLKPCFEYMCAIHAASMERSFQGLSLRLHGHSWQGLIVFHLGKPYSFQYHSRSPLSAHKTKKVAQKGLQSSCLPFPHVWLGASLWAIVYCSTAVLDISQNIRLPRRSVLPSKWLFCLSNLGLPRKWRATL